MLVRELKADDWQTYKTLRLRAFKESSYSFSESYEDEIDESESFFQACMGFDSEHYTLGVFNENSLLGMATFKRDKRLKARHKSYIHTMYVAPEMRGQGAGKRMLLEIISRSKKLEGLEQIHLWVLNPETSIARKLYLNIGFIPQGSLVRKDLKIEETYVDAEYMSISLS